MSDKTGKDAKKKGFFEGSAEEAEAANLWAFDAMLFPELIPGAACKVESSTLNGEVVIRKAVYSGDNWDGDYKIELEAEAL
jgi:hypothetical protein